MELTEEEKKVLAEEEWTRKKDIALETQETISEQQQAEQAVQQKYLLPFQDTFAVVRNDVDLTKAIEAFSQEVEQAKDLAFVEKTINNIEDVKNLASDVEMIFSNNQLNQIQSMLSSGNDITLGLFGKVIGALADLDDPAPKVMNQFCMFLNSKDAAELPKSASLRNTQTDLGHKAKFEGTATSRNHNSNAAPINAPKGGKTN